MNDDYEWDIYEVFKEQIEDQMPHIESSILELDKESNVGNAIDDLFRVFHNYKATASYLKLTPLQELSHKAETILGSLREDKKIVQDSIIEWLLQVKDQLERWLEQMNKYEVILSKVPDELNQKIKVSKSHKSSAQILKKLTLLYIDDNNKRAEKIIIFLKQLLDDVKFCNSNNYKENIQNYDIIMRNLDKNNYPLIEYCSTNFTNLPIISIFDNIEKEDKVKLLKLYVSQYTLNPLTSKKLQKELIFIAKTYFSSKNILIDNKKIINFIKNLKPLPNTIHEIAQVCDDSDKSINDLIKVVKSDAIISANILKFASSPMFGSAQLTTIDQAITRLGKRAVKALAMNGIQKNLAPINLSSYEINQDVFSKVSMMRLSLMLKWYSKVSISDLSTLSSTALLGNIGQILISQELVDMREVDNFKRLYEKFDINYAEESIIHTTTCLVSAQILNYWKLSETIIDVITHTDNPLEAPLEIQNLAIANHIVYSLIDVVGNVVDEIPENSLALMKQFNLDEEALKKALNFIIENK